MKINIIIPGVGLSGGMRVVFTYAELLNEKDHDVILYSPIKAYDVKNSKNELLNYMHVVTNSLKRLYLYKIKKVHKNVPYDATVKPVYAINNSTVRDADITMATAWPTSFPVSRLNSDKGKKVYFVQDYEIWNNERLGKKSYELPLHKIVISTWINKKIMEQLSCEPMPIVYDGIDLGKYNNKNKCFKEDYKHCKCLMLYHDLPKKGVANGIKAFKFVQKKYPKISLEMFGMLPDAKLPKDIKYHFNPDKKTLQRLYQDADIFIFPSLEEGWGLTPLEAMASKCAVVGTNTGCFLDIGKNGYNAMLSKPGDIESMADNFKNLIEQPERMKTISLNGYETAQQFAWDKTIDRMEDVLRSIVYEDKN